MDRMFVEDGPVEILQLAAWAMAALVAATMAIKRPRSRDNLFMFWVALLCTLAGLRELDAHLWIGPRTIGYWGVNFWFKWWFSLSAPVLPRVLWFVVGVAVLSGLVLPLVKVWPRWPSLLRSGDRALWCFALGVAALGLGYSFDDLIGRERLFSKNFTKPAEESFELLGACLILAGVCLLARIPLATRERLASLKAGPAPSDPAAPLPPRVAEATRGDG
jgi:hypothetical protein